MPGEGASLARFEKKAKLRLDRAYYAHKHILHAAVAYRLWVVQGRASVFHDDIERLVHAKLSYNTTYAHIYFTNIRTSLVRGRLVGPVL